MKNAIYIGLIVVIAVVFYLLGQSTVTTTVSDDPYEITPTQEDIDFEYAVENLPRGSMGIPAQWFVMESFIPELGDEKMMLIFGYADNKDVCDHLVDVATEESPNRTFKCVDAN